MENSGGNVDKKSLLSQSLAKIMIAEKSGIDELVRQFPRAAIQVKEDNSPVTELDLQLSSHFEEMQKRHFDNFTFYSEEKFSKWEFPLLALDPLDGTREYIEGRDEWAISLGLFPGSKFAGEGWVYNPKTGECFDDPQKKDFVTKSLYHGEVSRTEWKKGFFTKKESELFKLSPMGSIAYKLGRLSAGKADFVISLTPKNIWDVAGGSLLCQKAGFRFYSQGKEVTHVQKLFEPPLIWCQKELFPELSRIYS